MLYPFSTPVATRPAILVLLAALSLSPARAGSVITFAGTGERGFSGDGGPAAAARLNNPFGVARGPDGFLYLCDVDNHRIRRVAPDGVITTFAGNGRQGYAGDGGLATAATLDQPYELAWDRAGFLCFVDIGSHTVRRIDPRTGVIATVAGTGQPGFSGDGGPAAKARLNQPHSLAFDAAGSLLVCDILNHRIRRIDLKTGMISTWAGTGDKRTAPDGSPAAGSPLFGPRALALAADGGLWLALREGNAVLRIDPQSGQLRRLAGTGQAGFTGHGRPAREATLSGPKGVSLDAIGNVYLADTESHTIRMIDVRKSTLELLVGDGRKGDGPDGDPLKCRLARPHGIFVDRDGSVFIGDSENHRVRLLRR